MYQIVLLRQPNCNSLVAGPLEYRQPAFVPDKLTVAVAPELQVGFPFEIDQDALAEKMINLGYKNTRDVTISFVKETETLDQYDRPRSNACGAERVTDDETHIQVAINQKHFGDPDGLAVTTSERLIEGLVRAREHTRSAIRHPIRTTLAKVSVPTAAAAGVRELVSETGILAVDAIIDVLPIAVFLGAFLEAQNPVKRAQDKALNKRCKLMGKEGESWTNIFTRPPAGRPQSPE